MTIRFHDTGSIFDSGADALVNPVNTVGVMGAGLAKQFRVRWPDMFQHYKRACRDGEIKPGKIWVYPTLNHSGRGARYIVCLPTKRHWRDNTPFEYIVWGLSSLAEMVPDLGVSSLAVPAVGCGLGGLPWTKVQPEIYRWLSPLHIPVDVYGPQ